MNDRDTFLLETIVGFCEDIMSAIDRHGHDFKDLEEDLEFQYVCSFLLIQIGEYVNDLSAQFVNAHPEIPWHDIVAMRNVLTHHYGKVSNRILHKTIMQNIPDFLAFCKSQLS